MMIPPDPGPIATRDLWLKQSNGIRVYKNHAVYVKCRRIGETVETRGEISKTFRDKLDPDWLAWNRYPYYSDYAINGIDPKLVLDFKGDRYRLPSGGDILRHCPDLHRGHPQKRRLMAMVF